MTADNTRSTPRAALTCAAWDPRLHRAGTKAAAGTCSWTETCKNPLRYSVEVRYADSGRCTWFGSCLEHHARIHQYFQVEEQDPVDELRHLLEGWAEGFAHRCRILKESPGDDERRAGLAVGKRGIQPDEAVAFLRTWRAGLVTVGPDGSFTSAAKRSGGGPYHLVGRNGDHVALHTEYLIHLGAFGELVLDEGWSLEALAFEQGQWDILGYDGGRVFLAVEAKARAEMSDNDSLEALRRSLIAATEDPQAPMPSNHRNKWDALVGFAGSGPVDVRLVAANARWRFRAELHDGRLSLRSIES